VVFDLSFWLIIMYDFLLESKKYPFSLVDISGYGEINQDKL